MSIAYLNDRFMPLNQATVPVTDRAFLFGDAVYEVIPVYDGRLFRLDSHLARLQHSLDGLQIRNPMTAGQWSDMFRELIERNGGGDLSLYLQVTRGAPAARDHAFPEAAVAPTVVAFCQPLKPVPAAYLEDGIAAVTLPDERWAHCNIKSTALLANVMLKHRASDAGAVEALLVRNGRLTEGSSSNVFVVLDGEAITPVQDSHVLPGVTRDLVLELARDHGLPARFGEVAQQRLANAEEIWICSSTRELLPVTSLDGTPVGDGRPGPVWRRFHDQLQAYKESIAPGREACSA